MSKYFYWSKNLKKLNIRYAADKVFPRCAFYLFSQRCPNQVNYSRQYSYLLKLVFAKMFAKNSKWKFGLKSITILNGGGIHNSKSFRHRDPGSNFEEEKQWTYLTNIFEIKLLIQRALKYKDARYSDVDLVPKQFQTSYRMQVGEFKWKAGRGTVAAWLGLVWIARS